MLSDDQLMRYSRQILLPQIDVAGQEKLAAAKVLIIGAGGLGTPAALYLAGAGVGQLTLVDDDRVEISNLHRQVAYRQGDVSEHKSVALAAQLRELNGEVSCNALVARADSALLAQQVPRADIVLDCSDNFATRMAVNQACHDAGVPLVSGAAIRMEGQLAVFDFRQPGGPCYQCLFGDGDEPDTLCSESGVLGPVVGMIGMAQALEAIKLICGLPVASKLHLFDGATFEWRSLAINPDTQCQVCASDYVGGA